MPAVNAATVPAATATPAAAAHAAAAPVATGVSQSTGRAWPAHAGRLTAALAVFVAAVWAWAQVAPGDLRLAALAFTSPVLAAGWLGVRLRAALRERADAVAAAVADAADVLGTLSSGVLTVDAAGRLLYANAAAEALLGVAARPGAPVLAEVAARAPGLADALARAARDGRPTRRGEAALGDAVLGVTTTVRTAPDGARAATAIFSDITASRQLADAQARAARLEAVAELAASLAHEIRNPLAGIQSAVEQLARLTGAAGRARLGREDAADARALAALTVRESDRLSRLLGEFLDFSRARVTRRERVDVARAARDAARLAAAHPDAAGVAVQVEAPAEPLVVEGDAELLHRALANLALNAAQATAAQATAGRRAADTPRAEPAPAAAAVHGANPGLRVRGAGDTPVRHSRASGNPGSTPAPPAAAPAPVALGTVRVAVRAAAAGEAPDGAAFAHGAVCVAVSDDGPGVAPELVGRLFEPFVSGRAGGSGLGLAVVQRAVEAHGGVVLVEPGGGGAGARFTCVLPRAASDRAGCSRDGGASETHPHGIGAGA